MIQDLYVALCVHHPKSNNLSFVFIITLQRYSHNIRGVHICTGAEREFKSSSCEYPHPSVLFVEKIVLSQLNYLDTVSKINWL